MSKLERNVACQERGSPCWITPWCAKVEECLAATVWQYLFHYAIERWGWKKKKKRVVVAPGEGWREGRRGVETLSLTRRGFSPRCSGTDGRATGYVGNASHASPFSHSTTTICCHREIARPLNFLRLSVGSWRVNIHASDFYSIFNGWNRIPIIPRGKEKKCLPPLLLLLNTI